MAKTNFGLMACHECGAEVVIKQNERGTLNYTCQICDYAPYAKVEDQHHRRWKERMRPMSEKIDKTDAQQGARTDLKQAVDTKPPAKNDESAPISAPVPAPQQPQKPQQKTNIWGLPE